MEYLTNLPEPSRCGPHGRMGDVPLFGREVLIDAFVERMLSHVNSTCELNARHGDFHVFKPISSGFCKSEPYLMDVAVLPSPEYNGETAALPVSSPII